MIKEKAVKILNILKEVDDFKNSQSLKRLQRKYLELNSKKNYKRDISNFITNTLKKSKSKFLILKNFNFLV